ncbi:menin-like, partial [Saccoglossus kowalevskii]|uniref:Menin n=1 Tax=Saccoglossus kowalevskii TaxID=10224 RepID=A0ABM0MCA0_SACKO
YNYNREDEEIYKEFLEIAHELIPNMLKTASLSKCLQEKTILCDPQCFAYVLQFYDGICQWEEGSCTPVLHIGWAKHFITCIAKFSPRVREYLHIKTNDEETMDMEDKSECTTNGDGNKDQSTEKGLAQDVKASRKDDKKEESNIAAIAGSDCEVPSELLDTVTTTTATPFTTTSTWDAKTDFYDFLSSQSNGSAFPGMTMESVMKAESPAEMVLHRQSRSGPHSVASDEGGVTCRDALPVMIPTNITFTSAKMKGLKDLLTSHGKVNTSAIQLQLTAQSQTTVVKRSRSATEYDYVSQRRRPRRE